MGNEKRRTLRRRTVEPDVRLDDAGAPGPRIAQSRGESAFGRSRLYAYYGFTRTNVAGAECVVARMGYTGESGFELHFAPAHAEAIWTAVMDAGAEYDIVPCGQAALESLRQEAGYLLVGNDHDKSTNPFEAGIGRVVKFNKPDFNRAAGSD